MTRVSRWSLSKLDQSLSKSGVAEFPHRGANLLDFVVDSLNTSLPSHGYAKQPIKGVFFCFLQQSLIATAPMQRLRLLQRPRSSVSRGLRTGTILS